MAIPGTSYIVGAGKDGRIFLVDTANMGHYNSSADQVLQVFQGSGLWGSPVYWNNSAGPLLYEWGASDTMKAYSFTNNRFNTTPAGIGTVSFPNAEGTCALSVSSNGSTAGTGIVWGSAPLTPPGGFTVAGTLYAFDASNIANELWDSRQLSSRDDFGNWAKWTPPTVANGKVYMATQSGQVAVYGPISASAPPGIPTGLTAVPCDGTIALSWTPPLNDVTYRVKRSTVSGGPYTTLVTNFGATIYSDAGLTNGTTYYYVVDGINSLGVSADSAQASVAPAPLPPPGGTGSILHEVWLNVTGNTVANIPINTAPYGFNFIASFEGPTNTSLNNYGTRIRGYLYPPITGSYTFWIASDDTGELDLSTDANPAHAVAIATVPAWTSSRAWFTYPQQQSAPITLTGGQKYYIQALQEQGGGSDNVAAAWQGPSACLPLQVIPGAYLSPSLPAPPGLTATAGNGQVGLSWSEAPGATSYNAKRSTTTGGPYTTISSPAGTTYTDSAVTNGTHYFYVVSAVNAAEQSGNSLEATATPLVPTTPPLAPTGVSAVRGNALVALSWSASYTATSYNVKRSTVSGSGYATVSSPATNAYINTGLTNGTTYYYVVSAVNEAGESANSNQASATPQPPIPTVPTGLAATPGVAQVVLSWNASPGATSYNVKRGTTNGSGYATVSRPVTSGYTNAGLTIGTLYYYVVSAVNAAGESANSNQASATVAAISPVVDFSGDGKTDLVLQNSVTNQVALWYMNGPALLSGHYASPTPSAGWGVVGTGDMNGDNKPDLVLQNARSNQIALWYLNGATFLSGSYLSATPPAGWRAAAIGDFNGDGKPDIALQSTATRQIALWYLDGTVVLGRQYLATTPAAGWRVVGAGDFNKDGKTDLVLQNSTTNQVAVWYLNGVTVAAGHYLSTSPPAGWNVVGIGDYNGDGYPDVVLQNSSTNVVSLWYLHDTTLLSGAYVSSTPAANWKVAGPK